MNRISMNRMLNQVGGSGWMILLWLIGIPIPLIIGLYVLRGCR